jgi:hypothetical protein
MGRGPTLAWMAALVAATMSGPCPARAAAEAGAEHWRLVLAGALGEGRDLELYAAWRDGRIAAAFGRGPRFNRMPYQVEARDVRLTQGRLSGTFAVSVPSDGYVPKGGGTLQVEAAVEAAAAPSGFDGTYRAKVGGESREGKLTGSRSAPPAPLAVARLTLSCEETIQKAKRGPSAHRLGMAIALRDGRSFAARLIPPGSITDVALTATVEAHAVRIEGERLTGKLTGLVRHQGGLEKAVRYDFEFAGLVIGRSAAGAIQVVEDGTPQPDGRFVGQMEAGAAAPADALWRLTLQEAIPPHNFLNLFLTSRAGRLLGGFATSPNFNNSIHTLDLSHLRLQGGRLAGRLGVRLVPDAWIPRDHKPVACTYDIGAAVADGEVAGTFTGRFGETEVKGSVEGGLEAKPDLRALDGLTLKVEGGSFGRAFHTLRYEGGRLAEGRVWNNHTDLTGTVEKADLDWSDEKIRGSMTVTVSRGGVVPGTYTVTVDGVLVGTTGAGAAVTVAADGRRKETSFWVALRPAVAP